MQQYDHAAYIIKTPVNEFSKCVISLVLEGFQSHFNGEFKLGVQASTDVGVGTPITYEMDEAIDFTVSITSYHKSLFRPLKMGRNVVFGCFLFFYFFHTKSDTHNKALI